MANLKEVKPFDPNEGAADLATPWPTLDHVYSAADYVSAIMPETPSTMGFIAKSVNEAVVIAKATDLPPSMTSFTTMTLMPEVHNGGVLQPPGIPFESLRKVVRDNVAPQMIINQRVADVQRYANLSSHPWKPGWKIELRHGLKNPSTSESQDIRDAQVFLQNCNSEYGDNARKRDARQLTNFSSFLTQIVWDTFTYDGISIWTDTDLKGRIKAFKALSTFNIRLTTKEGWQGNPNIFAIGLDEAGNPIATFTRDELVFVVRNARADADIHGYGLSEVEQAIKSIQGISNAMDTAVDKFNKNAVPNGILTAEGMWTSRQLDVLTRIWRNLKMGQTKQWALPVIPIPKEGKLDLLDLTKLNGEDMRNVQFMNLMTGIFCAIFKFPIDRLGFHAAGAAPDNKPDVSNSPAAVRDETDAGLAPLLMTIENIINEYLLWPRWPHLCFSFSGKNPASDSREYEFKTNAMTWGERRAMADLPPLDAMGKDDEEKKMLRLISLAPTDSNLAGIYQNVLAAMYGKNSDGAGPEGKMTSKLDPAKSREHGHEAGARRDSASEAVSAEG